MQCDGVGISSNVNYIFEIQFSIFPLKDAREIDSMNDLDACRTKCRLDEKCNYLGWCYQSYLDCIINTQPYSVVTDSVCSMLTEWVDAPSLSFSTYLINYTVRQPRHNQCAINRHQTRQRSMNGLIIDGGSWRSLARASIRTMRICDVALFFTLPTLPFTKQADALPRWRVYRHRPEMTSLLNTWPSVTVLF